MKRVFLSPSQSLIAESSDTARFANAIGNDADLIAAGLLYDVLPNLDPDDRAPIERIIQRIQFGRIYQRQMLDDFDEMLEHIGNILALQIGVSSSNAAIEHAYKTPLIEAMPRSEIGTAALYQSVPILADFRDLLAAFHCNSATDSNTEACAKLH